MDYNNLKKDDLIELLKKSEEEKNKAIAAAEAEKNEELAMKDEELAALKSELLTAKSATSAASTMNPLTQRIVESERMRAVTMKTLFIPEDINPEAANTWSCAINGKQYLVPRGMEVEVPLPVWEKYQEQVANEKKARAAILKAKKVVEDGEKK